MKTAPQRTAHDRIIADMARRIEIGDWRVGERIPTLDVLAELYPYSRMTISQAARDLVAQGVLETRGRAGTVVLRVPTSAAIGLLANFDTGGYGFSAFTHAVTNRLRCSLSAAGWPVRVYHETPDMLEAGGRPCPSLLAEVERQELAGLITVASNLPEWERRHPTQGLPLPTVHISYQPSRYRVYIDFIAAAEAAVATLAASGATRIGLISAPQPDVPAAFMRAAARHGLVAAPEWIMAEPLAIMTEAHGYRAMNRIWDSDDRPDALFIPDDIAAKGVAQAAMARGIAVPSQLRLLCMANEGIEHFYPLPMDRLVLPLSRICDEAIDLLDRVIADPRPPATEILVAPGSVVSPLEVTHAR